ncbi:sensor histidine kinase [Leucobacter zeae]|nr:sensor histidine kinase [Leucobacter zeae]
MSEWEAAPSRPLRWWDLGVSAILVVMGTLGVLELVLDAAPVAPAELALILGALIVFALWYAALGRAALRRATLEEPMRRADTVYLVGMILIVAAATALFANYATLQVVAYPIVWTIASRYRAAVAWSGVLAVAVGVGFTGAFTRFGVGGGIGVAAAIAFLSFAFAVAMGTWITRIFAQGERYRALAEELRRSQAEVAALSESAGAAAERERLSRELHDTLTQTLAGLVMLSEQAERALGAGDSDRAADRLARVGSAAREAVAEARALVATTQPLGDGGLEAAIERVVARLRADTDLQVACDLEPQALDRERQVVLLRAAQEGLSNARKHARASRVSVSLARSADGGAVLVVDDDGVGPAGAGRALGVDGADSARVDGYGLTGLADRVRAVGGRVSFGAGPRGGSRLEVRLDPAAQHLPAIGSDPQAPGPAPRGAAVAGAADGGAA